MHPPRSMELIQKEWWHFVYQNWNSSGRIRNGRFSSLCRQSRQVLVQLRIKIKEMKLKCKMQQVAKIFKWTFIQSFYCNANNP